MLRKSKITIVTAVFLAILVAGISFAIASASNPSDSNVIYGCYNKNTGILRLVSADYTPTTQEVLISWNITGPQGPAGVGIASIVDNSDGTFTLYLTDGSSFTTPDLTGPQGEEGPPGLSYNPTQIALLRWYEANQSGINYTLGLGPGRICFDGANIWVSHALSGTVTKLNASDGGLIGNYTVGVPWDICFDGANVWVTDLFSNTVIKLSASDGSLVGTYPGGITDSGLSGICFDGASIWVANYYKNTVTKLKASDGSYVGTYTVGTHPVDICFDGANIWVANEVTLGTVTKLKASDGSLVGTYYAGEHHPQDICFDGANIWVSNWGQGVTKLKASDGALIGTYNAGAGPMGVCFDGANIWVANYYSNTVSKL